VDKVSEICRKYRLRVLDKVLQDLPEWA